MFSILSLIDKSEASEIHKIMEIVRPLLLDPTPLTWKFPHITWHSAEEYHLYDTEETIRNLAASWEKTTVRVTGIGMFTGKTQVLYLPVIKTPALVHMQKQIFTLTKPLSKQASRYFQPEIWIPHITIISSEKEHQNIPRAIHILSEIRVDFEVGINNLSLGQLTGETAEILFNIHLQK